jgi:hypothetical protein
MQPADYNPQFDDSLFVYSEKDGESQFINRINPDYCLTEASAAELVQVLATPGADGKSTVYAATVFDDWPLGPFGGPFHQSGKVPWLRIAQGGATIEVNAGRMAASYYAKAWSPDVTDPAARASLAANYDKRCRDDIAARLVEAGAQ